MPSAEPVISSGWLFSRLRRRLPVASSWVVRFWLVVPPLLWLVEPLEQMELFTIWARQHNAWRLGELISLSIVVLLVFLLWRFFLQSRANRLLAECAASGEELQWLTSAVQQSADMILITDARGVVRYVNPAFEAQSGFLREEVLGNSVALLRSDRQDPAFYAELVRLLHQGENWKNRFPARRGDGGVIHVDVAISPIRDREGVVTHYVGAARDVTREEELDRQLRQAQRLESIGILAGGIAHDFNNMLTAILSFAELTLDDVPVGSQAHHNLNEILVAAARARDLVKGLLTFSRPGEGERSPLLLGAVVRETMRLVGVVVPDTIRVETEVDGEEWPVLADSTQIFQVVMNLATNAAQSMWKSGGVLGVRLERVRVDGAWLSAHPARSGVSLGDYMGIEVRDTGTGIAPEMLEHIFEPFFTTRQPGEGSGLGLSVVHGIVKSHGGAIVVESVVGVGSRFRLFFPRHGGNVATGWAHGSRTDETDSGH